MFLNWFTVNWDSCLLLLITRCFGVIIDRTVEKYSELNREEADAVIEALEWEIKNPDEVDLAPEVEL